MNKHTAKKIARKFTKRKAISDVHALANLYKLRKIEETEEIKEAIKTLELTVLNGHKGDDLIIFEVDNNGKILECHKCTREESFQEPYRSLIDEFDANILQELIVDMLDNSDLNWKKEILCLSK